MKSYAFSILFRSPEAVSLYRDLHNSVWPELKSALRHVGVRSMQIFHMPPLELFMYIEATDAFEADRDFKDYVLFSEKAREWDETCGALVQRLPAHAGITEWAPMKKLYAYDRRPHRTDFI